VAAQSGILAEFREGKTVEDISRMENLEQLLNAIQEFTEAAETNGEPAGLDAYLATVSLLTDQDSGDENINDRVTLMTVHSAKGLEFSYVYVTGLEENLFPSLMSSGTARELEEERRLFYVAVTRAKKRATLSYAMNRYKWGNLESSSPSRFIREIDSRFLEDAGTLQRGIPRYGYGTQRYFTREENSGYESGQASSENVVPGTTHGVKPSMKRIVPAREPADGESVMAGIGNNTLAVGDRVRHDRFGPGTVIGIEGNPPDTTAIVDFTGSGRRKLLLRFAKLVKI
jgi:DNA helicase-2/ATP-dependent DNA helicase PcrA